MEMLSDALQSQMYGLFKQLSELDTDNNNVISLKEWEDGLRFRIKGVEKKQLRQAFKQIDVNNDGVLSWDEVKQRISYFARKNNRKKINNCLKDLVLSCVSTRESGKLCSEERTNRRRRQRIRNLRQECDEIGQYNKDVSQSLHLSYQLPSKLTPGYTPGGHDTPGATSGKAHTMGFMDQFFGGDGDITIQGTTTTITTNHNVIHNNDGTTTTYVDGTTTSRRRPGDEDGRFAVIDQMGERLHDTRESNSRQDKEVKYFRALKKKLKSQKRNINDILANYNCEAEQIVQEEDDDSVYTGNGNGTGGPGLNITGVDYERKVITLQNTCKTSSVNAGNYYLVCDAGRFSLPRRGVWPKGNHGDKLEVGLGGSKNRYDTEVFWPNVIGPMLASSELKLMIYGSKVGRGIPGHKLARETPRQTPWNLRGGAEANPVVNDRVKIRTTIDVDLNDQPIFKYYHGTVLEVYPDREEALVEWQCPERRRRRNQHRKFSELIVET